MLLIHAHTHTHTDGMGTECQCDCDADNADRHGASKLHTPAHNTHSLYNALSIPPYASIWAEVYNVGFEMRVKHLGLLSTRLIGCSSVSRGGHHQFKGANYSAMDTHSKGTNHKHTHTHTHTHTYTEPKLPVLAWWGNSYLPRLWGLLYAVSSD